MTSNIERRKGTWTTPLGLTILTVAVGFTGWSCLDILTTMRASIVDIKTENIIAHERLWQAIKGYGSKIDCVQNQLSKCCKDSIYCG